VKFKKDEDGNYLMNWNESGVRQGPSASPGAWATPDECHPCGKTPPSLRGRGQPTHHHAMGKTPLSHEGRGKPQGALKNGKTPLQREERGKPICGLVMEVENFENIIGFNKRVRTFGSPEIQNPPPCGGVGVHWMVASGALSRPGMASPLVDHPTHLRLCQGGSAPCHLQVRDLNIMIASHAAVFPPFALPRGIHPPPATQPRPPLQYNHPVHK